MSKIRVAINGYGVIGRRVVDAVALQEDMEMVGIADVVGDYRLRRAQSRGFAITPKGIDAKNKPRYESANVKFIYQGGAKHDLTGHSFVASANYESAVGRNSTRVVSYAYQVDNQGIVIPENIDAIRALAGREPSAQASIESTNQTLGVRQRFV
jgi:glyceraldehyde-3-phosphate dehydrogenase/erythrose-4-phosphate dehydrogenase